MEVLYDEVAVPKSPFRVGVTEGCDPTRVRAFGPGLESGLVNKANRFTVETRYPSPCLTLTWGYGHLDLRHTSFPFVLFVPHPRPSFPRGKQRANLP